MGTKALPHAGIGVPSYAWSSSPLRRYTDLVNQWQIIACAKHGRTAALAAPFKPRDTELFAIISAFDATYAAYNGYQQGMERFWTLKYLHQQGITELVVSVFKEIPGGVLVRADDLPLVLPVMGVPGLPRGARLRIRLGTVDEIALDVSGTLLERLDNEADADGTPAQEPEGEDDDAPVGPIALAMDLSDPEPAADTAATP
jgi:exoribonuclease-2